MKYIMYLLSTLHNICPCCSKFHAHLMCESTFKYNMVTHQVSRCSLSVGSDHSVLLSRPHCWTSGLARSSRSVWPVVAQQVLLPVGHTQASSSSPLITSPITTMQLPVLAHTVTYTDDVRMAMEWLQPTSIPHPTSSQHWEADISLRSALAGTLQ